MSLWPEISDNEFRLYYVQAGPIRTRCIEAGKGEETLILLHGAGGHLEAYLRNVPVLADRYRVFAFDFIGHGFTDKPDRAYEIHDYVQHVLDFCDAVSVDRAHFCGSSRGGWVASRLAFEHPDRVHKLVLNTAAGLDLTEDAGAFMRSAADDAKTPTMEVVRKRIEWLMYDKATVTEDLVEMRCRIYCQPGFGKALSNIMSVLDKEGFERNRLREEDLGRITAPTLVLWTADDPSFSIAVGERFRDAIPGAEMVVMEKCGHWPQFEDAAMFNRILLDFLGR